MYNRKKFILEAREYNRLIEEGRDPVELLHYKYQQVPSDIIDAIIAIDPTKKKSYSQWALNKWNDESETITNNLKNGRLQQLFNIFKQYGNEIQLQSYPSVANALRDYVPDEDTVLTKSNTPNEYVQMLEKEVPSELANDFDIVFNKDGWMVAVPHTFEADCKLGENSKWCTANYYKNGSGYFDKYLGQGGKYYVNFDMNTTETLKGKEYPYKRYQFHFESGQFMDINNNSVDPHNINMPESAFEFYESEGYDEDAFADEETRREDYMRDRFTHDVYWIVTSSLYIAPECDQNYNTNNIPAPPDEPYYLFNAYDELDYISDIPLMNPRAIGGHPSVSDGYHYAIIPTHPSYNAKAKYLVIINDDNNNGDIPLNFGIRDFIEMSDNHVFMYDDEEIMLYSDNYGYLFESNDVNPMAIDNVFENVQITDIDKKGRIFIELVMGTYHTLITTNYDNTELLIIIQYDIPENGTSFETDDNGVVITKSGKRYSIYPDDDNDDSIQENITAKFNNILNRINNARALHLHD